MNDAQSTPIGKVVASGERLRMELLDALRQTPQRRRWAGITELVMFYGQAFANVCACLAGRTEPGSDAALVLHEAIQGLNVYKVWQGTETELEAPLHYEQMARHWWEITRIVLGKPG